MSRWKARLLVLVGYVVLAIGYAWPLPLYFWERVVLARGSDFYPHVWNLWWMRFSLLTLNQNPYHTDYLYYPTGLPLVYHVLDPLNGLLSIPLQLTFGLIPAFNLLRLFHLIFSAVAAYALCRVLGLPKWAAWAGGALYMACPVASTSFDLGQLVEISTGWLPLYILCLIKAVGNRALNIHPGGWRWVGGAGLTLAASFLSTPYFFIALLIFTILYVAWELASTLRSAKYRVPSTEYEVPSKDREPLGTSYSVLTRAALVGLIALLALSPLLIAILRERATGVDPSSPLSTVIFNSADLLAFFLPAPARLTFPDINPHGGTPALGLSVIALAALALFLSGKKGQNADLPTAHPQPPTAFWLVTALTFALLALGPHLLISGNDTGAPMPFALFSQIPFLGVARVPLRFVLLSSLALSILAAVGLYQLTRIIRTPTSRALTLTLAAALLAIELVGIPRALFTPQAHPFWRSVAANGPEGRAEGVLELPHARRIPPSMYVATVHQHPIVSGYVARRYPYPWLETTPGIAQLVDSDLDAIQSPDILSPTVQSSALAALDHYRVRYVALYPTGDPDLDTRTRQTADLILTEQGVKPTVSDPTLTVWKVPPQPSTGPLLGLGDGWYGVEYRVGDAATAGAGGRWRWTDGDAQVQITNPTPHDMPVTLTLAPYTFTQPRTLNLSLDSQELSRHTVNPYPAQTITLPLTLTPGAHSLRLQSAEPPEQPPGDSRLIAIGYERVMVEKR